jgi:hypothetical protein
MTTIGDLRLSTSTFGNLHLPWPCHVHLFYLVHLVDVGKQ